MNRRIRKIHRTLWIVLAVGLPLVIIVSVAFRHHEPVNPVIPPVGKHR